VPWSDFPASLKQDVDAYLQRQASDDLLSEFELKPLRPKSIATRLRQFHLFASALVRRGYDPSTLKSIADLVEPQAVNDGLRFYLDRPEGKQAVKQASHIAGMLKSAAKHWIRADEAHLRKLQVIRNKLKPKGGIKMTPTNIARVRPLADPVIRRQYLNVAATMVAKLPKTGKPLRRDALLVQSALAIEMLQMFTPRLSNLVNIRLERNIVRSRNGVIHFVVDAGDTKNDVAIEKEFPEPTAQLLDLYLERYRPVLLDGPSQWLFPGKKGAKSDQQLRSQIMTNVKRYCGLTLNPHAFRHAGAKLFLRENPGQYGVMKLVLNHADVTTTEKYYCDIETEAASELFDRTILKLRDEPVPSKKLKGDKK
jgi:integrase